MPSLVIDLLGQLRTVKLDSDGRVKGIGNPGFPDFTEYLEVAELPFVLREAVVAKIQIRRENMILPDNRPHTYFRGRIGDRDYMARTVQELCYAYAAYAETVDYVENPIQSAYLQRWGRAVVTDAGKRFLFYHK